MPPSPRRLSVVLPSPPDRDPLIRRSVRSLLEQVLPTSDFEVVVAWDGQAPAGFDEFVAAANDRAGSPGWLRSVARPRAAAHANDPHPNHARNAGAAAATAPLVWVTGSDWLFPPNALRDLLFEHEGALARGSVALLTPTMAAIGGSPGGWVERTAAYERGDEGWAELMAREGGTLSPQVHCGFFRLFNGGRWPDSTPLSELGEGMMSFPKSLWTALDGFDERFLGWGGNYEEFNNRVMNLRGRGLLEVRLLSSVRLIHQPHLRNTAATSAKRQPGQTLRARKKLELDRVAAWWKKQLAAAEKALKAERAPPMSKTQQAISVVILTCDRPKPLMALLQDLAEQAGAAPNGITVSVYDDASSEATSEPKAFLAALPFKTRWVTAPIRHGKHGFHRWVSTVYAAQKAEKAARWIFLPDDVRLCDGFFPLLEERWASVSDPTAMLIQVDSSRKTGTCWTSVEPSPENDLVEKIGWWDGMGVVSRKFFETLSWRCPPIPKDRWVKNPLLGSGVGSVISHVLVRAGARLFRTKQSLVVSGIGVSRMNPEARARHPMVSADFVGSDAELRRKQYGAPVIAGMASIPSRIEVLKCVVDRVLPQVDSLFVYLNGHAEVPEFLVDRPGVRYALSKTDPRGDLGDAGKFVGLESHLGDCFYLSLDDDIKYPADYVLRTLMRVEGYGRQAVVSWHGANFTKTPRISSFRDDRLVFHCRGDVAADAPAHILGTGVMAFHSSTIRPMLRDFKAPNMADIWMGALGQSSQTPFVALAHKARWIDTFRGTDEGSIWEKTAKDDRTQTRAVNDIGPWSHYSPDWKKTHGEKQIAPQEIVDALGLIIPFLPPPDRRSKVLVVGPSSTILAAALRERGHAAIEEGEMGTTPLAGLVAYDPDLLALSVLKPRLRGRPKLAVLAKCSLSQKGQPAPIKFQRVLPGCSPRGVRVAGGRKFTLLTGRLSR